MIRAAPPMDARILTAVMILLSACSSPRAAETPSPYVVVLGVAQDAGHPQAGCAKECCRAAWDDEGQRHRVTSLGIVDPGSGQRWLIDATPDLPEQLRALDVLQTPGAQPIDGVFLTHAHIGHYTGLMYFGREVMGANSVPVHAMPRMASFLRSAGPWSQLVELSNIDVQPLADGVPVQLAEGLEVTPFVVPHRDELSETVGFTITGPGRSVVWLPDIDKWDRWSRPVEELLDSVDVAWLDGTFYADGEIARDMASIPHPFIVESMDRFAPLPANVRARVRFVHFNHTNPAMRDGTDAADAVRAAGFGLARRGDRVDLGR